MSDFWHKLGCCVVEKPQPKKRRRRIDRSMIGEPMNFVHLTHIGSGDMAAGEGLPMVRPGGDWEGAQHEGAVISPLHSGSFPRAAFLGGWKPLGWHDGVFSSVLGCPGLVTTRSGGETFLLSLQTGAVQEMRSKGGRERQWSSSRVL
uniref:CDC42 small effector 1 n=1 Tax=Chrysolophus pictus TaxID=9089 RepID=A0A8C3L6S8_CHRPC